MIRNAAIFGLLLTAALGVRAGQSEKMPDEFKGVGVSEKLGSRINLDLEFIGEDGYPHKLREYFSKGRPVILNLVYYTCPMLCNLVLNGQTEAMRELPWTPGDQYEVVTISIDPTENFGIARNKKAAYLASLDKDAPGWHFLTDYQGNAKQLANQVGFNYKFDEKTGQYAHAAAIMILSPQGMMSRYLYGTRYKPMDLRLSLAEAAREKFSGSVERFLLLCFHYDPASKSYSITATNIMKMGAALTVVLMVFVLFRLWRRERNHAAVLRQAVIAK